MIESQLRTQTYQLLANLFYAPPNPELLSALSKLSEATAKTPFATALQALCKKAAVVDTEALDLEFHRLFIGLSRGELLPYGCYYLTGFLMEKPLALLRQDLDRLGIQRQTDNKQPEDHISALCEVMALLTQEQNPAQSEFFQRHIKPWFSSFFSELKKTESADFYRSAAELGEQFILLEQQYFDADTN